MAIKSSFKQQCPSCEAMVPIRDPKLIGRKIDCPKCKYRFVVEEPVDDVDEEVEEEEAPAKKGKSGAAAITNKKPTNGKAGKPAAVQRRPDDDEDDEESRPKKKKSGGSGMLIIGIGLAAVALIALAVGAVFLFTGDDKSSDSKPSGNASANRSPTGGGNPEKPPEGKDPTKEPGGLKPKQEDVTNLLPNDTQVVLNLPLQHLFGNAKVNQSLLKTPGAFHEDAFHRVWGITPVDVRRVVLGFNGQKKTVFSVMRTSVPIKEEAIVAGLKLKPQPPVGTLKFYLVEKPLDALSSFLLKGEALNTLLFNREEHHDKVALHFVDAFTVVCADLGTMNQFLQEKGQPKVLSKQPVEEPQGGRRGGMGGMPGAPPGMPGAPPGMPGAPQPPGRGPKPPGGAPPAPGAPPGGAPPAPGAPPGGAGGGFQPPGGMRPGGMMPGGMFPGGGGTSDVAPVSSSYMTIDPQLKAVLDQAEKVDKQAGQNVLLSFALSSSAITVEDVKKGLAQKGDSAAKAPDFMLKFGLANFQNELKAAAIAVTEFNDSKVVANAAVSLKDAKAASTLKTQAETFISGFLLASGLDLVSKSAGRGNFPGMPGGFPGMQGGMQGGARPGGFQPGQQPGGGGFQPGQQPGGGGFQPGQQPGGGGFQPGQQPGGGGFPGMQPPDGSKQEEKGKRGDYSLWTKDNVLALGVTLKFQSGEYAATGSVLEYAGISLRGVTAMSDRRSHIHELAAALQAYHDGTGHFPRGTVPRSPDGLNVLGWRPDQRLSWMTDILPYLANGEFKALKPDPKNNKAWYEYERVGFTVIPHFVASIPSTDPYYFYVEYPNLSLKGPGKWAATHFVGVAGVGLDAADYRDGDAATAKLRGVFGYDRATKKDAIKDGLDQTIAVIQVPPEPKSPWIAGGGSTVRGVSDDLDCVRPFVCAKYKNKEGKEEDGTFAIMADGKVRFIPASIDPKNFQALCTIAGGEKIKDLEVIAPEVPPPPEEAAQPELKAEQPAPPAVNLPPQPKPANPPAGGAAPPADARLRTNQLKMIGLAYHNCADTGKPPAKVEDLAPFYENDVQITAAIKDGTFVVFWNASFRTMKAGTSNTILAYEKDTPEKGGLVLMADGSVRTMNAKEFKETAKASGK